MNSKEINETRKELEEMSTEHLQYYLNKIQVDLFCIGQNFQLNRITKEGEYKGNTHLDSSNRVEELILISETLVQRGHGVHLDLTKQHPLIRKILKKKITESELLKPLRVGLPKVEKTKKPKILRRGRLK